MSHTREKNQSDLQEIDIISHQTDVLKKLQGYIKDEINKIEREKHNFDNQGKTAKQMMKLKDLRNLLELANDTLKIYQMEGTSDRVKEIKLDKEKNIHVLIEILKKHGVETFRAKAKESAISKSERTLERKNTFSNPRTAKTEDEMRMCVMGDKEPSRERDFLGNWIEKSEPENMNVEEITENRIRPRITRQ